MKLWYACIYSILYDILIYLAVSFMRHYKSYSVHILSFKHFQNGELHVQSQLMTVFQYYQKDWSIAIRDTGGQSHINLKEEHMRSPVLRFLKIWWYRNYDMKRPKPNTLIIITQNSKNFDIPLRLLTLNVMSWDCPHLIFYPSSTKVKVFTCLCFDRICHFQL